MLGLAVGVVAIDALYRGTAEWRRPALAAAVCLATIAVCWGTMPANRPRVGALVLRVAMVASLVVGAFVARRILFGSGRALRGEVSTLLIATVVFAVGLYIARRMRRL